MPRMIPNALSRGFLFSLVVSSSPSRRQRDIADETRNMRTSVRPGWSSSSHMLAQTINVTNWGPVTSCKATSHRFHPGASWSRTDIGPGDGCPGGPVSLSLGPSSARPWAAGGPDAASGGARPLLAVLGRVIGDLFLEWIEVPMVLERPRRRYSCQGVSGQIVVLLSIPGCTPSRGSAVLPICPRSGRPTTTEGPALMLVPSPRSEAWPSEPSNSTSTTGKVIVRRKMLGTDTVLMILSHTVFSLHSCRVGNKVPSRT